MSGPRLPRPQIVAWGRVRQPTGLARGLSGLRALGSIGTAVMADAPVPGREALSPVRVAFRRTGAFHVLGACGSGVRVVAWRKTILGAPAVRHDRFSDLHLDELRGRLSALGFWPFRPDGRGMNGGVQGCPSLADDACSSAWPARHADSRLGVLNERVEAAEVALRGRVGLERSVARYVANVLVSVVEVDGFPASTMVDPCII